MSPWGYAGFASCTGARAKGPSRYASGSGTIHPGVEGVRQDAWRPTVSWLPATLTAADPGSKAQLYGDLARPFVSSRTVSPNSAVPAPHGIAEYNFDVSQLHDLPSMTSVLDGEPERSDDRSSGCGYKPAQGEGGHYWP